MTSLSRQRGATLLISLIMLVVLTLFALSAINLSTSNLRIVGNMQRQLEATAAAQMAIEQIIGNISNFTAAPTTSQTVAIDLNNDGATDFSVIVSPPSCKYTANAPGYSLSFSGSAPQNTMWDIQAVATDNLSGASVTVHQGIKVLLGAGATCPN
jgi:Tfp pilus assembly protein PilX